MTQLKLPKKPVPDWEKVRDEWVRAVEQLVADVESWCKANDWPTRRIEKRLEDTRIGEYYAPALVIQVDLVKLMLEPVARFTPNSDGVVDLYRMPEYADTASLFRRGGKWEFFATLTDDKLPPDSRPIQPDSDVVGMTGTFDRVTFTDLVRMLK
jgi:hypothetical protein